MPSAAMMMPAMMNPVRMRRPSSFDAIVGSRVCWLNLNGLRAQPRSGRGIYFGGGVA
jgi:hypothetical protein